jgi:predicted hotdog family 3-hydroxylacyl-ACP dehydratase
MMMDAFPPVAELLPHAPPMVLLDQVVGRTDDEVTAQLTVRRDAPFFVTGQGIPGHVGIEYMAQACGVFAGLEARLTGRPVRLGFLLGTRRYQAFVAWLLEGWQLTVTASVVFREGQMGVFDCRIRFGEIDVATAQITVYQPDDAATARTATEEQVE